MSNEQYYDAEGEAFVNTFGGEYKDDDLEIDFYGLQIGDLTINNIKPEVFLDLARKMVDHLEANGRLVSATPNNQ